MTKTRNLNGVDATWDGYELDFTMSMDGLSELINCFREFTCGTYQLGLTSVAGDSAVIMMEVRCGEGRLRVSVEHRKVLFVGNKEAMSLLVDNMEVLLSMWAAGGGSTIILIRHPIGCFLKLILRLLSSALSHKAKRKRYQASLMH